MTEARAAGRRRPPREHDPADPRVPGVPLLRQLRRRLRYGVVLLLGRSPAAVRARRPGSSTIRSNAVVARILTGDDGLARGVQYFDRQTGAERQALAKVVVVGASCVDSTRILLNSKSARHPNGLGQRVGRDRPVSVRADPAERHRLPARSSTGTPTRNDRGIGGEHIYMPRFNHRPGRGARLPARLRRAVLEHGRQHLRRALRLGTRCQVSARRSKKEIKRAASGVVRDPSVRRGAAVRAQPHHRGSVAGRPLRRAAAPHRLPDRRERTEDDRAHGRHGRGDREGVGRRAGELPARPARRDGLGDPRARDLPDGRGSEAIGAEQRSTRCTKSGTSSSSTARRFRTRRRRTRR